MTTATLSVPDISCGHCKSSIEGAVAELAGIDKVEVSIDDRTVAVAFDDGTVDMPTIIDAIEAQGYEVAK